MNDQTNKNPNPIFNELLCPIMQTIMTDPVMANDGFTYERKNIEKWLETHNTSPLTNNIISKNLKPNLTINALLKNNYNDLVKEQEKRQNKEPYANDLSERIQLIHKQFSKNNTENDGLITLLDSYYGLPLYLFRILTLKDSRAEYFRLLENKRNLLKLKDTMKYFDHKKLNIFFQKIQTPEELQAFLSLASKLKNINDFEHISFRKSDLLDFSHNITIKLINFINEKATENTRSFFKKTKISFNDLKTWPDNEDGVLLFEDLLAYRSSIETLVSNGLTINDFKDLIQFKPEFRKKLLYSNYPEDTDWEYFDSLVLNEYAGIPWNKWVELWEKGKEKKQPHTEDTISFNEILENEKLQEFRFRFGQVIARVRAAWVGDSNKLKNNFYDEVSIQELWVFYQVLIANKYDKIILTDKDGEEPRLIRFWLTNGKVTPKKLIRLLTQSLNKKKSLTSEKVLINVKYLKQLLDDGSNEHRPQIPSVNHNNFQPLFQPWSPTVNNMPSSSSVIKQISDDTCTYSCFGIGSNCLLTLGCVTGIASGVGQYLQLPKDGTSLSSLDWKLLFGCMIVACFSICIDLLIKYKNSHSTKQQYHYHPSQTFMRLFCIAGLASMAGDALSICINRHDLNHNHIGIILFSSACALLITSAMIKKCIVEPLIATQRLNAV